MKSDVNHDKRRTKAIITTRGRITSRTRISAAFWENRNRTGKIPKRYAWREENFFDATVTLSGVQSMIWRYSSLISMASDRVLKK